MGYQITVFDLILEQKINALLDELNAGKEEHEAYMAHSTLKLKTKLILAAVNPQKEVLYNIVDRAGDIPVGRRTDWRPIEAIESELNIKL